MYNTIITNKYYDTLYEEKHCMRKNAVGMKHCLNETKLNETKLNENSVE